MENVVSEAKAEFQRAKDRLSRNLSHTPDDRINWSPSATARTPIEQVVHAATAVTGIHDMLAGKPVNFTNPAEMDANWRAEEKKYNSRDQALGLLDQASDNYMTWLDSLSQEQVASTFESPFGAFPMRMAITFPADHMRGHAAQMEYIQTIYGDQDWHMG